MRQLIKIIVIGGIFVGSFVAAEGQEPAKTTTEQTESQTKKAQNNNTVRSNRTDDKAIIDPAGGSGNSGTATSKKGYDYYKAKSDMNASKTKDHNSSRSNKSSSVNLNQSSADSTKADFNQNSSRSNNTK